LDKERVVIGKLVIFYLPMVARSLKTANVRPNFPRLWKEESGVTSASVLIFQDTFSASSNWCESLQSSR